MRQSVVFVFTLGTFAALSTTSIRASYLPVFGGPTYDASTGSGYYSYTNGAEGIPTAGNGVGIGTERNSDGSRLTIAVRWDTQGNAVELGNLAGGSVATGSVVSGPSAINAANVAVGYSEKIQNNVYLGGRAVRWDLSSSAAIELDTLGTDSKGSTNSVARSINAAGEVVGYSLKYANGVSSGTRAVRWAPGSTAITELGNLGTGTNGTSAQANSINDNGVAVGQAELFTNGVDLGQRAVRWTSDGVAQPLGTLNLDPNGVTSARATRLNASGMAIGYANNYDNGKTTVDIAVRWDAAGNATRLGNLDQNGGNYVQMQVYDLNDAGNAVGYTDKYVGSTYYGIRAVRWDSSTGNAIELANIGTDSNGQTRGRAVAINNAGYVAGSYTSFVNGTAAGDHAMVWDPSGTAIDLNTLIDPASGWTLTNAFDINDNNWVTGVGSFDPDGSGPRAAYVRPFLLQVPEPSTMLELASATLLLRRRRQAAGDRPRLQSLVCRTCCKRASQKASLI